MTTRRIGFSAHLATRNCGRLTTAHAMVVPSHGVAIRPPPASRARASSWWSVTFGSVLRPSAWSPCPNRWCQRPPSSLRPQSPHATRQSLQLQRGVAARAVSGGPAHVAWKCWASPRAAVERLCKCSSSAIIAETSSQASCRASPASSTLCVAVPVGGSCHSLRASVAHKAARATHLGPLEAASSLALLLVRPAGLSSHHQITRSTGHTAAHIDKCICGEMRSCTRLSYVLGATPICVMSVASTPWAWKAGWWRPAPLLGVRFFLFHVFGSNREWRRSEASAWRLAAASRQNAKEKKRNARRYEDLFEFLGGPLHTYGAFTPPCKHGRCKRKCEECCAER